LQIKLKIFEVLGQPNRRGVEGFIFPMPLDKSCPSEKQLALLGLIGLRRN
jgi:hypothetical protein